MSVTELRQIRDDSSTGRIAACPTTSSTLFPDTAADRRRRAHARRHPRGRARRRARQPARRLRRGDAARERPRLPRRRARTRSSSTGRRRSRTSRCCGCSPRRASAPTSRRSASCASRGAPGIAGERLVDARQQQVGRRAARRGRGRRARRRRLARGDRPRARGRRDAHADPRHAGGRGRHARAHPHRPPRLEVRPAARRRARGAAPRARDARASTPTSARSCWTPAPR